MMDSVVLNQTLMGPKPGKHLSYWFDAVGQLILKTIKDECGWVANRWAELLFLPAAYKQSLRQKSDPPTRLRAIDRSLDREDKG